MQSPIEYEEYSNTGTKKSDAAVVSTLTLGKEAPAYAEAVLWMVAYTAVLSPVVCPPSAPPIWTN